MNRTYTVAAGLLLAGLVACGGETEDSFETTEQEIITEPATETMEVEVPTEDTLLIERETEVDVDVDTTEIEGDEVTEAMENDATEPDNELTEPIQ